ncbi:MAG: glucuronate isomerase, partial [Planctomycetes bacterium]|nr:glucuronate isomerase [Planctomycetota bacterium]
DINDYPSFLQALKKRHDYFHQNNCRLSDLALEIVHAEYAPEIHIKNIFNQIRSGHTLDCDQQVIFKSALLIELAQMDHEKSWVRQLHLGTLRNTNSRLLKNLGLDAGGDSIGDGIIAQPLARYLDRLDNQNSLPKTIIYNINPTDNESIAALIGCFQDGSAPGKLQLGPAWWFLDTKIGIENQINALSHLGLLSRFIGMCTDSRSFLSFPRHEYFRRLLCNILGDEIETGLLPRDINLIGNLVKDISFNNARHYFPMEIT